MWNNSNLTEAGDKASSENVAFAGTPEAAASPSTAKRQRRPSVRLEDLGEQNADRSSPLHNVGNPAQSKEDLRLSNIGPNKFKFVRSPLCKPGAAAKNGGRFKSSSPDVEKASCYIDSLPESHSVYKKVGNGNQLLKTSSKGNTGGRKPGRKLGVSKLTTSIKKSPRVPQSGRACRKEKSPCMQAVGMHSDKENNAHSSAGIIASPYHDLISTSAESGHEGAMMLNSNHNHEVQGFMRAHAQAQTQVMGERTSQQAHAPSRRQAFEVMNDADGKILAHADGSVRGPRGKLIIRKNRYLNGMHNRLVVEANGDGNNSMQPTESRIHHIACHRPWPLVGVREWLHNLGLGKYTKLFEAHEVEPEVLPLLTLEDLREMGVFAVGSRRKVFCAIQQLRKAMLPEAS